MNAKKEQKLGKELLLGLGWVGLASLLFHLSYLGQVFVLPLYFVCLWKLTQIKSLPLAYMNGIILGMSLYVYHLEFLRGIFNGFAYNLYCVLACWLSFFFMIAVWFRRRFDTRVVCYLIPILYLCFEFIRCEYYPLKFSWVIPGFAFYENPYFNGLSLFGVYGISFVLLMLVSLGDEFINSVKAKFIALASLCFIMLILSHVKPVMDKPTTGPRVTGVQLEFPSNKDVIKHLDECLKQYPETELLFLSEYTFDEGIPQVIKDWCKTNQRYLLVGSTEIIDDPNILKSNKKPLNGKLKKKPYFNMAMIVGPSGDIVFKQAKSMPIQFFDDGVPALEQLLWESPWGDIGICICYDLSYAMIVDGLAKLGARAILVPTMDVDAWGEYQHELHGRVAPTRATEYGVPVYRICSSGISQFAGSKGQVYSKGSFIGQGDILSARLDLSKKASRPLDRFLVFPAMIISALALIWSIILLVKTKLKKHET